ncbi:la protein homolog [Vanessa atalanta]|uniref:la protein homolog n=1 Tax=Vanessa atalanta TaxID=42275 RepID=UPI001FCDE1EC|nr:la protein homolog [Vanessa atalanta]
MTDENVVTETNGQGSTDTENNAEEETDLEKAIIRQIEYYFGDLNLPRDKFLREQVKLDDGWIPLEILGKFNRLAKLSTDSDVIANAMNKSTSGLIEVSEDNKKIRRNPEMPIPEMNEERRKELTGRTVYAKGFPLDASLDDILKYFKQFEEVENIIMRRYQDRQTKKRLFKGSVFATFKTKEQAEKFLDTKGLKYNETDLLILWQDNYLQQKQEEYAAKKDKKDKKHKGKDTKEEKEEFKLPTGTVLHFSQGHDKMTREDIKEALTPLGQEIAYVDFKVGDAEGWVRLSKENSAKELAEKITDGKIKIGESEVVFRVLEDEEEKTYLDKTVEEMSKRRKNMKNFKQNKGKNFKGKQGRKRKPDHNNDGPPAKIKANDS